MFVNTKLNKHIIRYIINIIKGYELFGDGLENIPSSPVIYASTHQDFNDHFNIVLSRIDAWRRVKVSIDDERKIIYGVNNDFYLFHHINDIAFDSNGNVIF